MRKIFVFSPDGKHSKICFRANIRTTLQICKGFHEMGYRVLFGSILF